MAASGIHSSQELLNAQAHIWNHIFNFINSMSLKCTVQLGIPDIIHKHSKPMTLSELTQALSIAEGRSSCVERLMRIMIHSKFFVKAQISKDDDKLGYWLTQSSRLLLKDEPLSQAPFVLAMLDPILMNPWHDLSSWFKTDHSAPFVTTHGMSIWEFAGENARMNEFFNVSMAQDARLVCSVITKDCRHVFEGLKSVVDVGGGTGTVAKSMAEAFPGLKGIVLDLPHVVAGLEGDKNLSYVKGDMFKSIPPANAVFLKWILHDWPDKECVKLLKNCKEAIPSKDNGGKVIIVDMIVNEEAVEHEFLETQLSIDVLMMTLMPGKERTEKQWAGLFSTAGFTSYKITNLFGLRSLIEVFP